MLQPLLSWDLAPGRGYSSLPPAGAGNALLFDLNDDPRVRPDTPFDIVPFHMPQEALYGLAHERGVRRVAGFQAPKTPVADPA